MKNQIEYTDLWGLRKEKYKFLENHDIKNTKWQNLELKEPNYFFTNKKFKGKKNYYNYFSLIDIFKFYSVGGKPGDDKMLVSFNENDSEVKIRQIIDLLKISPNEARKEATRNLLKIISDYEIDSRKIIKYNYRPFDIRYTYYDEKIYTRPVLRLKKQFDEKNLALLTTKILKAESFAHVFISNIFSDVIYLSNKTSTNTFVFPLWIYEDGEEILEQKELFNQDKNRNPYQNLSDKFWEQLVKTDLSQALPEEIFCYIYAVLYSNIYRKKYEEFLKIDFPKIPFTKKYPLFKKLSEIGKELIDLHLLKSVKSDKSIASFPKIGSSLIEKREYIKDANVIKHLWSNIPDRIKRYGIIQINEKQFFAGVPEKVWDYYIGGYQVLDKWLKDRQKDGKPLLRKDINHFLKVYTALAETIKLQEKIDELYPEVEKSLIK